jgi:platelet-activating factor acetylhydrolase IB subunit alpha
MLLTSRDKDKLNRAILAYLQSQGYPESASKFEREASITGELGPTDQLEKKWGTVVRLQQKVMSLQNELNGLKEEMTNYGPGKRLSDTNARKIEGVPRVPEKFALSGHREPVTFLSFHPVYSILASASEDGSIRIWDYESGVAEKTLKGHTATVNAAVFEPNSGMLLVSCSADLSIKIWNFETFECTKTLHGHDHNVSHVAFLPSGDFILSSSRDTTVKMWEVATGFCIRTFAAHTDWVRRLCINSAGGLFASCSSDETIILWAIENTNPLQVMCGHSNVIENLAFASEAAVQTILSADYRAKTTEEEKVNSRAPEFLASCSRDKSIMIWDCWTGACLTVLRGHDNWVRQVIFHSSGKYLYSASDDKSIRLWDLTTGGCYKKVLDAHTHFVTCIALNPRMPMLASGSVDKTIKVWECR